MTKEIDKLDKQYERESLTGFIRFTIKYTDNTAPYRVYIGLALKRISRPPIRVCL